MPCILRATYRHIMRAFVLRAGRDEKSVISSFCSIKYQHNQYFYIPGDGHDAELRQGRQAARPHNHRDPSNQAAGADPVAFAFRGCNSRQQRALPLHEALLSNHPQSHMEMTVVPVVGSQISFSPFELLHQDCFGLPCPTLPFPLRSYGYLYTSFPSIRIPSLCNVL